ncbi:MAG: hypothetical protein HZC06_03440 [Methylocystis sp.]|nr:hypothetical protein [Methylocystis sp.]
MNDGPPRAVALSIAVLAIYVTAYDDYDLSERLRATGRFSRQAMRALSFPLGAPVGWLLDPLLEKSFGCGDENEPCAAFVDWNTHFAALVAQIVLLRWLIRKH